MEKRDLRRSKKAGLDLSINSVVIVVFAITMLGLGLALIKGWIGGIPTLTPPTAQATENEPIVLPTDPISGSRGKELRFTFNFYNNEPADIPSSVTPKFEGCISKSGSIDFPVVVSGQNVETGKSVSYKTLLSIPKNAASGSYACTLKVSQTSRQFFVEVK